MSLMRWFPFVRDLSDNGVAIGALGDNMTPVNNGGTFSNDGKLGKCIYLSGATNTYVSFPIGWAIGIKDFSIALWVKIPKITSGTYYAICTQKSAAGKSAGIGIYWNYTQKKFLWSTADGTNSSEIWMATTVDSIVYDKWIHLVMVRNSSDPKIGYFYINGTRYELASVPTVLNIASPSAIISRTMYIGQCSGGDYPAKEYVNDFRLYDHALSVKEVQLLCRGLTIHYTLADNIIQQMNNCYNLPTFNSSAAAGGWSHWGASGHDGTYGQNTTKAYIFNQANTYSHWVANGSGATSSYLLYQSPAFEGGFRSMCFIIKEESSKPITESIVFPTWNANASGGATVNKWSSIQSLSNGFYLCKVEGLKQDGSNDLVGVYVTAGNKIYVSEAYLENDRTVCSDIRYYSTNVCDCSGNQWTGTATNPLIMNKSTPKYKYSTTFNGTSGKITLPNFSPYEAGVKQSEMSFAMWINRNAYSDSASRYMYYGFCDIYLHSDYKVRISWSHDTTSASAGNTWAPGLLIPTGEWHHICFTFTSGIMRLYYDGALYSTSDRSSTGQFMGVYHGYPNIGNNQFGGSLSDFRIYSTALSADAIKELYQVGASIDKSGNMYAYEFNEV